MRNIINDQYKACHDLLTEKRDKIEALAERLLEKETISLPDIVEVLGPRPFPLKEQLANYLEELKQREEEPEESAKKDEPESEDSASEMEEESKEEGKERAKE